MIVQLIVEVRMPQDETQARKLVAEFIRDRKERMTLLDAATALNVAGAQMDVLELRVKNPGTIEF